MMDDDDDDIAAAYAALSFQASSAPGQTCEQLVFMLSRFAISIVLLLQFIKNNLISDVASQISHINFLTMLKNVNC